MQMTDDIVTRLRECWCANAFSDRGKVDPACDHDGVRAEAADEIEYLRSEMENVNSEYNKLWRKYEQALKDNSTLIHICQDPEGRWVSNG